MGVDGCKSIVVILAIDSPSGVGCADPGFSDFLANPQVAVAPVEGSGLLDFLLRLLDQLETAFLSRPEVWAPVNSVLSGVVCGRTG